MSSGERISIAILAGGQSRRMGEDKALLEMDGKPLIQHVIDAATPLSDDLMIVASDRPEYQKFGVQVIPDRYPQSGSLGGIYTAISEAREPYCFVLACDMPFVNRSLLKYMVSAERNYEVLIPALDADRSEQGGEETLETLHAIYSKRCLPAMERQINAGVFKVIGFFSEVNVRKLNEETIREHDPNLLSFFNANTPEEFAWAKSRLAGQR